MAETEFDRSKLKLNKKNCRIIIIMKKVFSKLEIKEAEGIKLMNQYKYLGLNLHSTRKLTAHIESHKIKLKKMTKMIFLLEKNPSPP
jgi:hypothetical protein